MQLTNLEQSQKLKEWGAPQGTYFVWAWCDEDDMQPYTVRRVSTSHPHKDEYGGIYAAAYSLDELIEWLPRKQFFTGRVYEMTLQYVSFFGQWWAGYVYSEAHEDEMVLGEYSKGTTVIEAVFNLCEAIHSKKGE